jgi:hypothetical protein
VASIYDQIVIAGLTVVAVYLSLGFVFAVAFVTIGVERVDAQAHGSGWPFRLLIVPGVAAFWPLLLSRWLFGHGEPPRQKDPHR